jgi:CRISPR-associated protein Csm4
VKFYEISLLPQTGFGTPLKGDTLFGHFCWQAAYDDTLLEDGLAARVAAYAGQPFVIFSSAFPKLNDGAAGYALKRPDMPFTSFLPAEVDRKQRIIQTKENKTRKWMVVQNDLTLDFSAANFITDEQLYRKSSDGQPDEALPPAVDTDSQEVVTASLQPHNTINRLTGATGTGMFTPYTTENIYYYPGTKLLVFVLIDESATDIERVCTALERIGKWGFGRDASTGLGRFEICGHTSLSYPDPSGADGCYTLAPSVPERERFAKVYFAPFIRFGKHGDRLAKSKNPFKNPVIMADEGAMFFPEDRTVFDKPYLGMAVSGVSKVQPETIVQGYAPYLPFKLEI